MKQEKVNNLTAKLEKLIKVFWEARNAKPKRDIGPIKANQIQQWELEEAPIMLMNKHDLRYKLAKERIKKMGWMIYAEHGSEGMHIVCDSLEDVNVDLVITLDHQWDGVGQWIA